MQFFLDESGHTGDAATLEWPDQPTFVLAAVGGLSKEASLAEYVSQLRTEHHIQMPELKGSSLYNTKSRFIRDLVQLLVEESCPVFVEVMDKKYYVTTMLVSYFLSSPQRPLREREEARDCNIMAEIVYDRFDDSVIRSYGEACLKRTPVSVYRFMGDFVMEVRRQMKEALRDVKSAGDREATARLANLSDISHRGYSSTKAFENLRDEEASAEALVDPFLPPSEENKRGETLAMLPHYSAFGNLYARINAGYPDEDVKMVHDEQYEVDLILEELQRSMESNRYAFVDELHQQAEMPWRDSTSLTFSDSDHEIRFDDSKEEIGIQVADVLAGFCRKYFDVQIGEDGEAEPVHEETAEILRELSRKDKPSGVNVVTSFARSLETFISKPPPGRQQDGST